MNNHHGCNRLNVLNKQEQGARNDMRPSSRVGIRLVKPQIIAPLLVLLLWYFGDALFNCVFAFGHIIIELGETGIEHFYEALFHANRHTIQIFTAWTGLILLLIAIKIIQVIVFRHLSTKFPYKDNYNRLLFRIFINYWDTFMISFITWILAFFYL